MKLCELISNQNKSNQKLNTHRRKIGSIKREREWTSYSQRHVPSVVERIESIPKKLCVASINFNEMYKLKLTASMEKNGIQLNCACIIECAPIEHRTASHLATIASRHIASCMVVLWLCGSLSKCFNDTTHWYGKNTIQPGVISL